MIHIHIPFSLSAETIFLIRAGILAVSTAVLAVRWNRWTIRRMLKEEFVRQLFLMEMGTVPEKYRERNKKWWRRGQ